MDDLAEAALIDTGNVFVDGDDAGEVDGFGVLVILAQYFYLGMVNNQAARLFFDFPVGDDLMSSCYDLRHERHIEPAAGDLPRAEDAAGSIHDDSFVETCFSEAFRPGINHAAG